jgi:DNA invertase Pin-like site-specific DNA recombinase
MSKTAPRRAYSYVRFSHPRQADSGSLKRQTALTEAYCERKGLTLDDTLTLYDLGVSAFRSDNVKEGALAGFLEACRSGRVAKGSYLVVESLDRLSRDQIRPALQLFLALQDYGITIITLQPEREYSPDSADALALIEPLIVFARAHEESAMKSHRRRDGWKQARDKARAGGGPMVKICPAWLEVTEDGFREKPEAVAVVRQIYAMARDGLGLKRITARLVREGVPPIAGGPGWVTGYVYRILSSPAAMGTYQPYRRQGRKRTLEGEPIPNYYPVVVTEAEWREVQTALQARGGDFDALGKFRKGGHGVRGAGRKGKGEPNLFTGLVRSALTGKIMWINHHYGRGGRGQRPHCVCLQPSRDAGIPTGASVDYSVFEQAVLSLLTELDPSDITAKGKPENGRKAEIARLSGRLLDIDSRLERAQQRARTAGDFDAFLDLIQALQEERKQIMARRAELEQGEDGSAADLGEAQSLIDLLATTPAEEREEVRRRLKMRIAQLVTGIWVVIVRRGMTCLCAVQVHFRGAGRRREFLIVHIPRNRYAQGRWWAKSLASVVKSGDLDLRKPADALKLEKLLALVDVDKLLTVLNPEPSA